MTPIDLGSRYSVLREIGRGSVGRVFLVRDHHLGEELALKLLFDAVAEERERLEREFSLLAEIDHPGIARVYDFGVAQGRSFYTSQFVHGRALGEVDRPYSFDEALRLLRETTEAVAYLHRSAILHLDIKPSNIVVAETESEGLRPVLIDFGLGRRTVTPNSTRVGQGSLPFMAPEALDGRAIGPAADVYALGVTFYRVLTGRFPRLPRIDSGTGRVVGTQAVPVPLRHYCPEVSRALEVVLLRCLANDERSRYSSAEELETALRGVGAESRASSSSARSVATTGRDQELEVVERFLEGIRHPVGSIVPPCLLVTASSGMGQSHFLREIKVRAQTRGLQCYPEAGYAGERLPPGSLFRCFASAGSEGEPESQAARQRWSEFLDRLSRPREGSRQAAFEEERRGRRAAELAAVVDTIDQPVVLVVDRLELRDEVSIELLIDLLRHLESFDNAERPPVFCVLGYREEGSCGALLRELTALVLDQLRADVIRLGPLDVRATLDLVRTVRGTAEGGQGEASSLSDYYETEGVPAKVFGLSEISEPPGAGEGGEARQEDLAIVSSDAATRMWLLWITLLERPVSVDELGGISQRGSDEASSMLATLEAARAVERLDDRWVAKSRAAAVTRRSNREQRFAARRDIVRFLVELNDDASTVEAVLHLREMEPNEEFIRVGLRAAKYLESTYQTRAALDSFRWVLNALPAERVAERVEVLVDIAQLLLRVGEIDDGIEQFRDLLASTKELPRASRAKAILWLAILYARRGDIQRADRLFVEGFQRGESDPGALTAREYLRFLNEHAAVKTVLGFHDEALELCREGLRRSSGAEDDETRELTLNLYATRASVAVRRFDYDAASQDFETALGVAESIGAPGNQAVLLNNLGMVHAHRDRYPEAIRAYRDAERLCARLDEGPSLVSIYGNLAILAAKTGDLRARDEYLRMATELPVVTVGPRQKFFLAHAVALCEVTSGRYDQASERLELAIQRGTSLGDRHVVTFDRVYAAETCVFLDRFHEAREILDALDCEDHSSIVRGLVASRRVLVDGFSGRPDECLRAIERYEAIERAHPVAYLEAWNELFVGWALTRIGESEGGQRRLRASESYFRDLELSPGLALATAARLDDPEHSGAREETLSEERFEPPRGNHLAFVVYGVRFAEELAERLDSDPSTRSRIADIVVEVETALSTSPIPMWDRRLERIRERMASIQSAGPPDSSERNTPSTETVPMRERRRVSSRAELVVQSPGMRQLLEQVSRWKHSDRPLVIRGETGTGKDLIARLIHEEGPRASGPFLVFDASTIPDTLLDVELFGASDGSYTDQGDSRAGIICEAAGGTLLIDGAAGLSLEAQGKILRVVEELRVRPVGGDRAVSVDVRFLFSAAKDLREEVEGGRFRRDLFHRIQVAELQVPPLRERLEDFGELARRFLATPQDPSPQLARNVIARLQSQSWPGNVRELRNTLERLRIEAGEPYTVEALERVLRRGGDISAGDEAMFPVALLSSRKLDELRERLEREYILYHFRRLRGRTPELWALLGVGERHFYRICRRLGIRLRDERRRLPRDGEADR